MYNEPNIGAWTPTPNVGDYINLATATGKAIKTATPSEVFRSSSPLCLSFLCFSFYLSCILFVF